MSRRPSPDTLLFLALWMAAVLPGVLAVRGLHWPYDIDGFRDLAAAQSIQDGRSPFADAFYPHEVAWYSPLVPTLVAALSWTSGASVPHTSVQAGPWLNAFAPLAFYACARTLIGRWPALLAVTGFLLLPLNPTPWAGATYSPWLFPSVFAQAIFYGGLILWSHVLGTPTTGRLLIVGIVTGLAFLTHGGAGILLAGIIGTTAIASKQWRLAALPGLAAVIIASPFLVPLVTTSHLDAVNRLPTIWSDDSVHPRTVLAGLAHPWGMTQLVVAVVGARALWRTALPHVRTILLAWGGVAFVLYGYCLLAIRVDVPALMPAFHFYFPLRAWTWVLMGSGLTALAIDTPTRTRPAITAALVVASLVFLYPRYLGRDAFRMAPALSRRAVSTDDQRVYAWLRRSTPRGAIILASDREAMRVIGPAGRFVLSVTPEFSNPYVAWLPRAQARDRMIEALASGDAAAFAAGQRRFGITHVVLRDEIGDRVRDHGIVIPVFTAGPLTVFDTRTRPNVIR